MLTSKDVSILRKCGVHGKDIMTIVRCGRRHSPHTRGSKSVYPNKIRVGHADLYDEEHNGVLQGIEI